MNKKVILIVSIFILLAAAFGFSHWKAKEQSILSSEDAISVIIREYPEFENYSKTSLPPSSIETKETEEGWYVSFIQKGSGLPGILNAKCFLVTKMGVIDTVGIYVRSDKEIADTIDLETCAPIISQTPTLPPTSTLTPTPTRVVPTPSYSASCYVGGCSGQICSNSPDTISTCEYREEYACYRDARCERQANGNCGWTETAELKACLQNGGKIPVTF